jgi:hypothetical protein
LRGGTPVEQAGASFTPRLRPYSSHYERFRCDGPYYDKIPIPMTLVINDVWRGIFRWQMEVRPTCSSYFRGDRKYDFRQRQFPDILLV